MKFTRMQLEALKELANIGSAHAATSLSQIIGSSVNMTVPDVSLLDISDLGTVMGDEVATMVVFELQGDLPHGGFLLLHFSRESASKMAAVMCGVSSCDSPMSELMKSALVEAGNIMVSSFLNASSELLGIMMLPSPPYLVTDILHATVQSLVVGMGVDLDDILVFRIQLTSPEYRIEGNIVLLIEESTLQKVAEILESMVGNP
ncbi:MAG TPA: chemotaxis protein CheC [Methanolinea sp.]|jgi:chemotaxis protein CheC|nr:chemotaxis protein CheC [Methanolinea sp.]HOS82908.1 chemotaxis protein CheC [Methanolinea sp.]HPC56040.1 chemotaxis protein CheC [Methanolinea sp.]HQE86462.1 chemotaxis protein CheC [Methanolinea sp.]HQI15190.1 chemotaxis protein CheC [Methanolinea sp.]